MVALRLRLRRPRRAEQRGEPLAREPEFGEKPPYLVEYLAKAAEELGEEPQIVERLTGEMKKWRKYNLVYPVGGGIFIHVYTPREAESGYNKYVAIEPPRPHPRLLRLVEEALALVITHEHIPRSSEEKKALLLELLEKIIVPVDETVDYENLKLQGGKIPVHRDDIDYLKYHVIRDKIGVGILEPFLRDPYLEDITCGGVGPIYIVHKMFGSMETSVRFETNEELDEFVIKLGEKIGKPISHARPVVDATLPDGSRINIVFGNDVSLRGSNFTIRKVSKIPLSVTQLINWGTFDSRIAAYMWMMLSEGMSVFICGETASGKTTSLNAIMAFIRPTNKIVTIEDTAEVVLPHPNWTRELTRDTGKPESSVTMFDLLKAALRQRPNYIIVGEIRGAEGNIAFQAMQSVTWDTPVAVMDPGGRVRVVPIGVFIDDHYPEGAERVPVPVKGYRVLSLGRDGRLTWAPVRYVLRHRADKVYRVRYEGGELRATGSHSVFVLDEEDMVVKPRPVSGLRPGDLLVVPAKLQAWRGFTVTTGAAPLLMVQTLGASMAHMEWVKPALRFADRVPARPLARLLREAGLSHLARTVEDRFVSREEARRLYARAARRARKAKPRTRMLAERIEQYLAGDFSVVEVISVREEPYGGYVYDVSVPGTELFFGGSMPVALHNTGHPVMATFHAANLERLIQRLTNPPISVPKTNMDSLNIAWFQSAVHVKGFPARRVITVNEIIGYDPASDAIAAMPVFTWDPVEDRFLFAGRGASYLLEEKIAVMRGIPRKRIKEIYDELELRARFLQTLVDKKVFDYFQVYKAIVKAYSLGVEEALKRLEQDRLL